MDSKKQEALVLIARGKTINEVSQAVGVTRKTIYNWLNECPEFRDQLDHLLTSVIYFKFLLAMPYIQSAVETMVAVMNDENNKPSVRLQAAKDVLSLVEQGSIFATNSKISKLEHLMSGGKDADND